MKEVSILQNVEDTVGVADNLGNDDLKHEGNVTQGNSEHNLDHKQHTDSHLESKIFTEKKDAELHLQHPIFVLGQFKTCIILLGGYLMFGSDPGIVSICGAVAALCGMTIYTLLNMKESREKKAMIEPPALKLKTTAVSNNTEDSKPDHPQTPV